jgi:tetratricopeptide (TPR) repeat protein
MKDVRVTVAIALTAAVVLPGAPSAQSLTAIAERLFKDANQLYQQQQYREAARRYEDAIAANPGLSDAYFFLGNSYDNQYRPTLRGEPANDLLIERAVSHYRIAAQKSQNPAIKRLAQQYLVNAYGPEKLNDPSQQESLLRQMIGTDPNDPANYFVLANVFEQSGDYERAEQLLLKAREVQPSDPSVYTTLAAFYNRQGDFAKTMETLHARAEKEPTNPEAYYTIATYYWEKAYRDFTSQQADKVQYVQEGHRAVDKALELNADYPEALTYKNLLLRVEASLMDDPERQQALIKEANQFRDRAIEIQRKQRADGAGNLVN